MARAIDVSLLARLPAILTRAGFCDVSVSVDTERVYIKVGRAGSRMRAHLEMEIPAARSVVTEVIGGEAACNTFILEYMSHFNRHDRSVVMPLCFVKGRAAKEISRDGQIRQGAAERVPLS